MIYDTQRTRNVVDRLVLLGNNLRLVLVLINAVLYGTLLGILGVQVSGAGWLIFALVGALVGAGVGYFFSGALAAVLEWMAQVLISLQPRE